MPGLPYSKAEVVYAVRAEMARSVDDVLSRRTRARLLARDASVAAAPEVARLMAAELGWDDAERDAAGRRTTVSLIDEERTTGGLPETALDALTQPPSYVSSTSMETNRGAPTPPIAFAGDAAGVTDRLHPRLVEVGDELRDRLAATGAAVSTSPAEIGEGSRDWWPLAMIWALDNQVAARASVIVTPHSTDEVAAVLRGRATTPASRSPRPRAEAACAARASRVRRCAARPHRASRESSTSITRRCSST